MSVSWEVTSLRIHADSSGTSLFANGRMQVPANILIRAINPTNNATYTLTASELANIQLVDYYNTDEILTGNWTYTTRENEFSHTMPTSSFELVDSDPVDSAPVDSAPVDSAAVDSAPVDSSLRSSMTDQHIRYWVSSARAEVKNVGARIRQPNGTWVTTRTSPNDSYIAYRAVTEIRYSLANCEWWREDTASGRGWDQKNYFLRSKVHPFIVANRTGFRTENYNVVGMRNSMSYHRRGPHLHYFWPLGPRMTTRAGLTHYQDGRVHPNAWTQDIVVRQHANSLCFTLLVTSGPRDIWDLGWWYSPTVTMIDVYGNSGSFDIGTNELEIITIYNRGTRIMNSSEADAITYEKKETTMEAETEEIDLSAAKPSTH